MIEVDIHQYYKFVTPIYAEKILNRIFYYDT